MTLRSRVSVGSAAVVGALLVTTLTAVVILGVPSPLATAPTPESQPTLVVTDETGEELVATPVGPDTEIVVEYTHSVERTLVRDVYVAENGTLVMTRLEFSSFGAGLPSEADVVVDGGRYVYHPPRTEYETLRVMTGPIADHDLIVGDDRYDLAGLTDGGPVELTITERTRSTTID